MSFPNWMKRIKNYRKLPKLRELIWQELQLKEIMEAKMLIRRSKFQLNLDNCHRN